MPLSTSQEVPYEGLEANISNHSQEEKGLSQNLVGSRNSPFLAKKLGLLDLY